MPLPFDATLKDMVCRRPADFSAGFHLHGTGTPAVLNVELSLVSAATDVVLGFGNPPHELVDLNFQSSSDESLVERLLLYNVLLHYRYGVPIHSLVILLRPAADSPQLTGRLRYRGQGRRGWIDFRYEVIRLWQIPVRRLLRAELGLLPLAVLGQLSAGMRTERCSPASSRRFSGAVLSEATLGDARQIMTETFFLTGARVSREAVLRLYSGVRLVVESTSYDYVLDQGRIDALRETLLVVGRERFGTADEATQAAVTSLTDLDRLRRMAARLVRVNSWQELLRTR